jgi:hypothetical protein
MKNILIIFFGFLTISSYSQKKELAIKVSAISEAEVKIEILNNSAKNKYLFLDVDNLGVLYQNKIELTNINSAKMYLDFVEIDENNFNIPVFSYNNFSCSGITKEDYMSEIDKNTVTILPHQKKQFIINLYKQDETEYFKSYTIMPSKYYKVRLRILGEEIKKRIDNAHIKNKKFINKIAKYDFNNYESNDFFIKIKVIKMPPPPPPPPTKVIAKYNFEELMMKK